MKQLGRLPSFQTHVATKKPFALHLNLCVTCGEFDGTRGSGNQFFSRAIASRFATSSIAGRQVDSTNSTADLASIVSVASPQAGLIAARVSAATTMVLRMVLPCDECVQPHEK